MKKTFILLLLTLTFTLTLTPTLIYSQASKPVFDRTKLSESDIQNLETFRAKKDQPRFEDFQKIKHLFPTSEYMLDSARTPNTYIKESTTLLMTRSQLEELIGQPDFQNAGYVLGDSRCDCSVTFTFNAKGEVLGFSFSSCKRYFSI